MPATETPIAPSSAPDAFESQLESALSDSTPAPAAPAEPKPATPAPAAAKPEPAPAKPAVVAPKADVKPTATPAPKPGEKAPEKPTEPAKATGPKELREELERKTNDLKSRDAKQAELEARIKELDEKGKNTDALQSQLKEFESKTKKLEAELSAARFETSEQYKEKFEKPFAKLIHKTKSHVNSLLKTDGQAADFDRDFLAVLNTSNNDAPRLARELFGDDHAIDILGRRRQILELREEANEAVASERENWETNKKKGEEEAQLRKMQQAQEHENDGKLWKQMYDDLPNTHDDYRIPPDDSELAAARAKGDSLYEHQPKTKEEYLLKFAHIKHQVGTYEVQ